MEEKKNSKILVGILVVLLIVAICATGFLWYKLNNAKNKYEDFRNNYISTIKSLNNDGNTIIERIVSVDEQDEGYKSGVTGVYVDENNDAYMLFKKDSDLYSKFGEKAKINENVANIFIAYCGNGGFSDIILIKKDGTVDTISTCINGDELVCEKIPDAKDAITIIPYRTTEKEFGVGEYNYCIIDINGNKIPSK